MNFYNEIQEEKEIGVEELPVEEGEEVVPVVYPEEEEDSEV